MKSLGWLALAVIPLTACSGADSDPSDASGGSGSGGASSQAKGGAPSGAGGGNAMGGSSATGGSQAAGGSGTGGTSNGGASSGGSSAGGSSNGNGGTSTTNSGGNSAGGAKAAGGAAPGGASSGGAATGGAGNKGGSTSTGGKASGGTGNGGTGNGGAATGGTASGGAATGGSGSGGTATCDWSEPPSNVSAWVNESWNAQLGGNIKNRKSWLLDNVMLGKGQLNLCVRWGATKAPTAAVKSGMAGAVQKWFNDWFGQLDGYGCFPYPKITVKITGWAVKPANTSWVSDLDSSIKVYTETDGEGEPKCPDNCSFFVNPSHKFPNCAGGEAFHTDYWMWLDDSIDGAEAVGGDWGLRMPLNGFVTAMTQNSAYDTNTVEHEMGHGFAFQDYYDWTGSKPAGGSLMIIEAPLPATPTIADRWLLRRTWKESKALRGW